MITLILVSIGWGVLLSFVFITVREVYREIKKGIDEYLKNSINPKHKK